MTMHLYNKVYKSIQEHNPQFKNAEEIIAFYLEGAKKYMYKAFVAAKEDAFEARSNHSDNAIMLLSGIMGAIEQFPNDDQKKMVHLKDFCIGMTNCIISMNIKHDISMADSIVKGLTKMSRDWRRKADQKAAQDENTSSHQEQPQRDVIPAKSSPHYPNPTYSSQTNLIG